MPESLDFRNPESLGLQLVSILAEQLEGQIKLDRTEGTRFEIRFGVVE
jgi:two-component sensor histidine kinase